MTTSSHHSRAHSRLLAAISALPKRPALGLAFAATSLLLGHSASAATVSLTGNNTAGNSSFSSNLLWSDSLAPAPENDYTVAGGFALRNGPDSASATFAGNSLTLGDSATAGILIFKNQPSGVVVTVNNLTLNNGEIQAGGNAAGAANITTLASNGINLLGVTNRLNSGADGRGIIVDAPISGTGTLVKSTAGFAVLKQANSYSGGTSITGGVLHFPTLASMPATGTVAVSANATIAVNVGGAGEFAATGTGAGSLGGLLAGTGGQGAPVTLAGTAGIGIDTTNATGTVTYGSAITNLSLAKLGAGTLELTGGATFAGTGAGFPLLARQGTLHLNGGTYAVTGEAVVGGTYGTLAGDAGYNAKLLIDSSTLNISSWLSVGRGNGTGTVNSELEINGSSTVTSVNFSGGFAAGSALNLPKATITLNDTSTLSVGVAAAGSNGTVNIAEGAGSNVTLNINDTASFSQLSNANQTRVGMANGAVGTINVNGGTASFERDLVLGQAGTGIGRLNLTSGTVNVAGTTERWLKINENATSSGEITVDGGTLNLNANTDIRFSTASTSNGTSFVTLNGGAITGGVSSVVDLKNSSGATANNTLNLNGGTLTIAQVITNNTAGTATVNLNGGTLKATAATTAFISMAGANQRTFVKDGGAVIDSNTFNVTIPEALEAGGTGGLTKIGVGTLTLSAANTYTGNTTITTGTLALASTGSIANSAAIIANGTFDVSAVTGFAIASGQTLQGSGSVIGATTINGNLAPGTSPGVLTFSSDLILGASASTTFEINGLTRSTDYDGVDVNGSLTYGGSLNLVFGAPISAGVYDLIDGTFSSTTGTFASVNFAGAFAQSLTAPATITGSGWTANSLGWDYAYDNASGSLTITASAVPEPASFAALAGLAVLGFGASRRRRA